MLISASLGLENYTNMSSMLNEPLIYLLHLYSAPNEACSYGDVRLVNGRMPSEGRVEICFNGNWGTICHYGWSQANAAVVCSQLGYPSEGKKGEESLLRWVERGGGR